MNKSPKKLSNKLLINHVQERIERHKTLLARDFDNGYDIRIKADRLEFAFNKTDGPMVQEELAYTINQNPFAFCSPSTLCTLTSIMYSKKEKRRGKRNKLPR